MQLMPSPGGGDRDGSMASAIAHSYGFAPHERGPGGIGQATAGPASPIKPTPLYGGAPASPASPSTPRKSNLVVLRSRLSPKASRKPRSPAVVPRPLSVPEFENGVRQTRQGTISPSRILNDAGPRPELFTPPSERRTPTRITASRNTSRPRGSPHPHFIPNVGAHDDSDIWEAYDHFVFMDCDSPPSSLAGSPRSTFSELGTPRGFAQSI